MKIYADLHIHSGLSPCSSKDMTPNNIINMCRLKGLQVISVTDHNSFKNTQVISNLARKYGIVVVPGCELQTKEEIHILCYFRSIEKALDFQREIIYNNLGKEKNNPSYFGHQLIYDNEDNIVGEEDRLLLGSISLGLDYVANIIGEYGGVLVPAHVDKSSYSIISNLGFIPPHLNISCLELSPRGWNNKVLVDKYHQQGYRLIKGSDAHYLGDISEQEFRLDTKELSIDSIIQVLSKKYNILSSE